MIHVLVEVEKNISSATVNNILALIEKVKKRIVQNGLFAFFV